MAWREEDNAKEGALALQPALHGSLKILIALVMELSAMAAAKGSTS